MRFVRLCCLLGCTILLLHCVTRNHQDPNPNTNPPITGPSTTPSAPIGGTPTISGPNTLQPIFYNPDTLRLQEGAFSLQVRTSTPLPVNYKVDAVLLPKSLGIRIDSDSLGTLSISGQLFVGNYGIQVRIRNASGDSLLIPNAVVLHVKPRIGVNTGTALSEAMLPVTALEYTNSELTKLAGTTVQSSFPVVTGSEPYTFGLINAPSNFIQINSSTGQISAIPGLAPGNYSVSVVVSNPAGARVFANVLRIQVVQADIAPSVLTYATNQVSVIQGTAVNSTAPSFSGTSPVTFTGSVTPANANVTINPVTGVISASNQVPVGTYDISVQITNSVGTFTNANAFRVIVLAPEPPSLLQFAPNVLSVQQGQVASSATPTLLGTPPFTYSINATTGISIQPSTGVITVQSNAQVGVYNVSVTVDNVAGSQSFANAFTISVTSAVPSYALQIAPLLQAYSCTTCHGYTYNSARVEAGPASSPNTILNRINRTQGSNGFMPRNGTKMTADQINLIQQWFDSGMNP